jgi:hypothetical protein
MGDACFVQTLEPEGMKVGCLKEIAFISGFIAAMRVGRGAG